MNLPFYIAKRYLFSKKSTNAINIISGIAGVAMLACTMALVLVLSVFNGLEGLVISLYNTFNPDLKITADIGKVFEADSILLQKIKTIEGVKAVSCVLEENALLQYRDKNLFGRLKGVDDNFTQVSKIDTAIIDGEYKLKSTLQEEYYRAHAAYDSTYLPDKADLPDRPLTFAVLGLGVQGRLGMSLAQQYPRLSIFMPLRNADAASVQIEHAYKEEVAYSAGVFSLQQEFDEKYVLLPLYFVRQLLDYTGNEVSALEISTIPNASISAIKRTLAELPELKNTQIKDRYQQDEALYKVMRTEKWVVYIILTFMLILAAFTIVGALSMLVIEKKHDIGILKAMGASNHLIRKIFLLEGFLLAFLGASGGAFIAVIVCMVQQNFGLIKLQGNSFLVEAYPVSMHLSDFVMIAVTVLIISLAAAYFPAQRATAQSDLRQEE